MNENEVILNIHNNILLVGSCKNTRYVNQIYKPENTEEALTLYGESDLYNAYSVCVEYDAPEVFTYGINSLDDYLNFADKIVDYDFAYVVFLNLRVDDIYYNAILDKRSTYIQNIVEKTQDESNTIYLLTSKHASLYKDLDDFIYDLNESIYNYKIFTNTNTNSTNIQVVANNLLKYDYSNVILACLYCTTDISQYPYNNKIGAAIFNIDKYDNISDFSYFKTTNLLGTTVENLVNLDLTIEPIKICFIDRIVRYIKRDLDYTDFIGTLYNDYRKLLIQTKTEQAMDSFLDYIIKDYSIDGVIAAVDKENPGSVIIYIDITVVPINCLESVRIRLVA